MRVSGAGSNGLHVLRLLSELLNQIFLGSVVVFLLKCYNYKVSSPLHLKVNLLLGENNKVISLKVNLCITVPLHV